MKLDKYTMDEVVHLMFRRSGKSATEIAEALCVTANQFYRMVDEADHDHALAAKHLLPYMTILDDDTPLHYLAIRRNKMIVEVPPEAGVAEGADRLLREFQSFSRMLEKLMTGYFEDPTEESREQLMASLEEFARKLLGIREILGD